MRHVRGSCGSSRRVFVPWISTWPSATEASIPPRLNSGELPLCSTVEARRSTSTTSSSLPLESSVDSFAAKRTRLMAERASASADNVSRLRELLQTCSAHERRGLFSNYQPHRRRDVWPLTTPVEPPTPSPGVTARMKKSVASDTPRFLSTAVIQSFQEGASHNAAAAAQHGTAQCNEKAQKEKGYYHSPSWYGASPGTRMDIAYFTAHQSSRWNALFHDLYYTRNEPTAPLLRCPACVTQRLRGDVAMLPRTGSADLSASRAATETPSASSPLWMDPMELQRHLSYIHADELFTPQALKLYNAQVLRELRYSCGLAPALTPVEGEPSPGVTSGARKTQPARVILVVDVANVELGSPGELLEMLLSSKLLRAVTDFPVALCATHELFVPAISKALHTLYQLSRRHPASTLHVFFANTSLESGDLLTASYLNDLFLASPHCAVPPVVMLTNDVQQQRALTELHGAPAYGLGNGGHVHWVKPLTAAQLVVDLYAALESSQSLL